MAVTIAALAVAGCAGQSPSTTGSAGTAGSTAATAGPTASPSPSEAAELPSGSMWIEAPKAGIRFPVPDDWRTVSFQEVLDSGDAKAMNEAAKMMGVTPDQLQALADQLEVIVFGPTVGKFAVNINAIGQPGTTLPTARLASDQLEKLGGKVGTPVAGTTSFASPWWCPTA